MYIPPELLSIVGVFILDWETGLIYGLFWIGFEYYSMTHAVTYTDNDTFVLLIVFLVIAGYRAISRGSR